MSRFPPACRVGDVYREGVGVCLGNQQYFDIFTNMGLFLSLFCFCFFFLVLGVQMNFIFSFIIFEVSPNFTINTSIFINPTPSNLIFKKKETGGW